MIPTVLIDTNVMLDLLMRRVQFLHEAQIIFSLADKGRIKAVVCSLSFANAAYILRKKVEIGQVAFVLRQFASLVEISSVNRQMVLQSISENSKFTDIEDALQYYSAKDFGCDCIVTRDPKDFQNSEIPVYSPSEFLDLYNR